MIGLGELLAGLRHRAGMSQDELARRAGTSGPTVAAYERGRKEPRWSTFVRLAEACGATPTVTLAPTGSTLTRAERRSLALHEAVLMHLLEDPDAVRPLARHNLTVMGEAAPAASPYLRRWQALLDGPLADLAVVLVSPAADARELRQNSPFAGVLDSAERDRALAASCDKDYGYVNTLAAADLVDLKVVRARLASTPGLDRSTRRRIEGWLRSNEA
jgi:transcriptional regulator with XRE-family HTH domain